MRACSEAAILCAQSLLLLVLIYRLAGVPVLRALAVGGALAAFVASVLTGEWASTRQGAAAGFPLGWVALRDALSRRTGVPAMRAPRRPGGPGRGARGV